MNVLQILPNYIFIETKEDIECFFNDNNYRYKNLKIGDIFSSAEKNYYIVKPLDTIDKIAKKTGKTSAEIFAITGKNIYIGQRINF